MTSMDHGFTTHRTARTGAIGQRSGDPLPRLLTQLLDRAGAPTTIERAASRPWASALFEGRRHVVTLRLTGDDMAARRARFVNGLADAQWLLSGHFVADISIDEDRQDGDDYLLEISALTIEDW
ncbi:hypothetical protein [Sphingobium sp.]|uniref:hypothetical protein n=1 Tax=Sphingobium sp. TaxID=1912891 RepID=UPI003BB48EFF